jgi:ankyrin repeat protein
MPHDELPERPSLEYLKKLAKDRLRSLRRTDRETKLADAQLAIAREHGFSSWRAFRSEVEYRRVRSRPAFFAACESGDLDALQGLLDRDPELIDARKEDGETVGATALHLALLHADAVRLLLERGADPNMRDVGDNALPLHFAAGAAPLATIQALLDAGSDVHGRGDAHALEVIGWAACFAKPRHARNPIPSSTVHDALRHARVFDRGPVRGRPDVRAAGGGEPAVSQDDSGKRRPSDG